MTPKTRQKRLTALRDLIAGLPAKDIDLSRWLDPKGPKCIAAHARDSKGLLGDLMAKPTPKGCWHGDICGQLERALGIPISNLPVMGPKGARGKQEALRRIDALIYWNDRGAKDKDFPLTFR